MRLPLTGENDEEEARARGAPEMCEARDGREASEREENRWTDGKRLKKSGGYAVTGISARRSRLGRLGRESRD